jgi:HD superfamily phosphohydrolase
MPALKKIKDPIHGYVHYSAIEERLLGHRLILRLHHIRQNGAAYLVYPSMRVHRFEHSLGAMHIAGQMFSHAILFSTDSETRTLMRALVDEAGFNIHDMMSAIRRNADTLQGAKGSEKNNFVETDSLYTLYHLNNIDDEDVFCTLFLFQAVRIAALVHDIGHPPFSHTFETALKQQNADLYQNHEVVGLDLLKKIIQDIYDNKLFTRGEYDLAAPAAKMAAILESPKLR